MTRWRMIMMRRMMLLKTGSGRGSSFFSCGGGDRTIVLVSMGVELV